MRVLLDEELPHKLRLHLATHDARTVAYMGWNGLKNGQLMKAAADAAFEVFVTGDKILGHQQNYKIPVRNCRAFLARLARFETQN